MARQAPQAQPLDPPPTLATAPPAAVAALPAHDMSLSLADRFDRLVPALLDEFDVPGAAIGVLLDGRAIYARGFGVCDVASRRPVTPTTRFNVASVSKLVTAWGAMRLVEQGRLDLDRPVAHVLTRWRLPESAFDHEGVTMRRILSHTAGLSPGSGPGFFHDDALPTLEQVLDGVRSEEEGVPAYDDIVSGADNGPAGVRVVAAPGSAARYSNGGYRLAQLVIEETSGMTFAEFMRRDVLEPLGMTRSTFDDPLRFARDADLATPHSWRGDTIPHEREPGAAAGGLYTCLRDLLQLAQAEMTEPAAAMHVTVPPAAGYGLGHVVRATDDVRWVGHTGLSMGWTASFQVVPDRDAALVVLTNSDNGSYVHETLLAAWFRHEFGVDLSERWSAPKKRSGRLFAYVEWLVETQSIETAAASSLVHAVRELQEAVHAGDVLRALEHADAARAHIVTIRAAGQLPDVRCNELSRHADAVVRWLRAL